MKTELVQRTPRDSRLLALKLRVLLSKYSYEGIDQEELNQIWLITIFLLSKFPKGRRFKGFAAVHLALLLKDLKTIIPNGKPRGGKKFWALSRSLTCLILNPGFDYYGTKNLEILRKVQISQEKVEKARYPEPARVGVGYKDKGNARKVHLDGSPGWQEVATNLTERGLLISAVNLLLWDPGFLGETKCEDQGDFKLTPEMSADGKWLVI